MTVIRTTVTIYGWLLKIVQMLSAMASDFESIKQSLASLQASQEAQSKQLAEIIHLLTPSDPVAFRIDLTQSNQGE